MNKFIALAFMAIGLALVAFGGNDYVCTVGGISRAFSLAGTPNDSTVWLLIAGLLATITGIFGFTADRSEQS